MKKITTKQQLIYNDDIDSVIQVLKSDFLSQGPNVERFEKSIKTYFGGKYCSVVSNGTSALHLAGKALKWKENDVVISTPITFLATINCIEYNNAQPFFTDIDREYHTIDINILEETIKKLKKNNMKIKAVIGVDFAGQPCDWLSLKYLANKYDFQLVNDNCHALGSSYYNNKKYAVKYADIVTQSYHSVKNITTGEGGSVITNHKELYNTINLLRSHGMNRKFKKKMEKWRYEMNNIGYNFRLSEMQCALGISQLRKIDKFIKKRNIIAEIYNDYFSKIDNILTPKKLENTYHSYHLYIIQINFKKLKISKVDYFNKLRKKGIFLNVHYIPVHTQPYYKKKYNYTNKYLNNSINFYNNTFSIPVYPSLKIDDVHFIKKQIVENLV